MKSFLSIILVVSFAACGNFIAFSSNQSSQPPTQDYSNFYQSDHDKVDSDCKTLEELCEPIKLAAGDPFFVDAEIPYIERFMSRSMSVSNDVAIPDYLNIVINENKTLTIKKGATLTINGKINIKGKLVNNGTIILNGKYERHEVYYVKTTTDKWPYNPYEYRAGLDPEKTKTFYASIESQNELVNNGDIVFTSGTLLNNKTATIKNNSIININNKEVNEHAIVNSARSKTGGKIINNGEIDVNSKDYGIKNYKYAVIDNKGEITKAKDSKIVGTISGNKPKLKNS